MKTIEILDLFPEVENKCCLGNFMHDSYEEVNDNINV